ncbi:MAG: GGDEF domain-containing protein, partial [Selenomonadaceae bacterium]|nr:GGDEF domain-containing protein [Selenomonadaceae bacterium]
TAIMGLILFLCVSVMLWAINKRYISKLSHLQANVRDYADNKDTHIADAIEHDAIGKDEISALSLQIAVMIRELEEYMRSLLETTKELGDTKKRAASMNELANKDSLTGLRNKTAYDNEVRRIEWALADGKANFGIAVIDLNYLKRINDTYGHEQGNIAIKRLCRIICVVFAHSPVFRIGGDEFAVILKNDDLKNVDALVEKFNSTFDKMSQDDSLEPWERISAAIGIALYDPLFDNNLTNVFKRADKAMYARKKEMKAVRT